MNRRDFLKLSGMGALSSWAGGYEKASAREEGRQMNSRNEEISFPSGKKIDFHCHAILPAYILLSREEIERLEKLADKANVSTVREWEKKMD